MDYYTKRIRNMQKNMKCSYAVLLSEEYDPNVFYLSGFKGYGIFIVPKNGSPYLFASVLDIGNVKNKKINLIGIGKNLKNDIRKKIHLKKTIGLDNSNLSLDSYTRIRNLFKPSKIVDISEQLKKQREIKDKYEIKQIRRACFEASYIFSKFIKKIRSFTYEYEIKNYLESEAKRRGYDLAFDTIVASGKNASNPHYSWCKDRLRKGFLVIDFGIKVNGYCSDMTRTLFLGNPSKKEKEIYDGVLYVQKNSINNIKSSPIDKVDEYARKELGKDFIHSLGHGIGLEIHEAPGINAKTKSRLSDKVCFTIEPGLYQKDKFGIRIEDTLAKENNKIKILTDFTKKLLVVNDKVYK